MSRTLFHLYQFIGTYGFKELEELKARLEFYLTNEHYDTPQTKARIEKILNKLNNLEFNVHDEVFSLKEKKVGTIIGIYVYFEAIVPIENAVQYAVEFIEEKFGIYKVKTLPAKSLVKNSIITQALYA